MERPYFPELIDCLRATIGKIEEDDKHGKSRELQDLKRRVVLLIADLEHKPDKPKCA
jgi:hypothetical protein